MKRDARFLGAIVLLLGLALGGSTAEADLISPISSTFALTAESQVGSSSLVTDMDAKSQGSTDHRLSVAVSANSTAGTNSSLLVTGKGSAAWTSASTGEVKFTNLGWNAVKVHSLDPGWADLSQNVGWVYTFVSNVTGSFDINYTVTAHGKSSTNDQPLEGLNGFFLYEGAGSTPPSHSTLQIDLNASGSTALAITAGNTYTVEIQNFANLSGDIGTTKAHMNGTFDFDVVPAPEPSSLTVTIAVSCLGGIVAFLKRRRQVAAKS